MHIEILAQLHDIVDAFIARDVGDLMRVSHDGGRAAGERAALKFGGSQEGALEVHMRVHKARDDDLAADVHFFFAVIQSESRDESVTDGDIFMLELFGKDIQYAGAFEDEIGFFPTHRDVDDSFEVHMLPPSYRYHENDTVCGC